MDPRELVKIFLLVNQQHIFCTFILKTYIYLYLFYSETIIKLKAANVNLTKQSDTLADVVENSVRKVYVNDRHLAI